jgi:hypothetical protein
VDAGHEDDVRRIALSLPGVLESEEGFAFSVPDKGIPAVLVRLAAIEVDELTEMLTDAWRIQAPKALVAEFDATR